MFLITYTRSNTNDEKDDEEKGYAKGGMKKKGYAKGGAKMMKKGYAKGGMMKKGAAKGGAMTLAKIRSAAKAKGYKLVKV
mgnify:CR=1 FL=1